jgi:hypothetical protein
MFRFRLPTSSLKLQASNRTKSNHLYAVSRNGCQLGSMAYPALA